MSEQREIWLREAAEARAAGDEKRAELAEWFASRGWNSVRPPPHDSEHEHEQEPE